MNSQCLPKGKMYLGYYPIRGKCQVCRLLCEFMGMEYQNIFFTPDCWIKFQKSQTKDWNFSELPFVKDDDFVTTETYPISMYLCMKGNRTDLLGANLLDRIKVESFVLDFDIVGMLLGKLIELRKQTPEKRIKQINSFFHHFLEQKLRKINDQCQGNYFLGYLSIMDFYIYEMVYMFHSFGCKHQNQLANLYRIFQTIKQIPAISSYENSPKAITKVCPNEFFQEWKEKCSEACLKRKNNCC